MACSHCCTTVAKENRKFVKIGIIVAFTAAAGTAIYWGVKKHEPAVVIEFRHSLNNYISAIRTGTMEIENIEALMDALDKIKAHKNYKKFVITFSAEDIDVLTNRIYEYTLKLAQDNKYDMGNMKINNASNPIIDLQHYLAVQKKIFEDVA